jgi:hypothetical protein
MKTLYLILSLLMMSCGKPKKDGDVRAEQIRPRTIITRVPEHSSARIKVFCYYGTGGGGLAPAYMLKGNFYRGNYSVCDDNFESCMTHGIYVHYFAQNHSCLTKKGFEEQFTVCLSEENPDERSSNVGTLVRMDLTIDRVTNHLWCEKRILEIMLKDNSEA